MSVNRRDFLKQAGIGLLGAGGLLAQPTIVEASSESSSDSYGMLFDASMCIGCKKCQEACREKRSSQDPKAEGLTFDPTPEELDATTWTLIKLYQDQEDTSIFSFVKVQCMHCVNPACASACPVGALEKTPEGPVIYHDDICIGCRYCMAACPFNIPKYQWDKVFPLIRKCDFCAERQKEGQEPACAEACKIGALKYGKREDLLAEARARINEQPDKYVNHIYGEHEIGGTSKLYISSVPFEKLNFPTLDTTALPDLTRPWMSAVPGIFLGVGSLMSAVYFYAKRRAENQKEK
jgi:formate dehydrogenase iron-sulfur subunit